MRGQVLHRMRLDRKQGNRQEVLNSRAKKMDSPEAGLQPVAMAVVQEKSGYVKATMQLGEFATALVLSILAMNVFCATGLNADGAALLDFKKAVLDPRNVLRNWNASDATPCNWNGISCMRVVAGSNSALWVVNISLPRKSLAGTISPSLGKLAYLDSLILHTNNLSGQIPAQLFNALNLSKLFLAENSFTGGIPAEIGNLGPQLHVFDVSNNALTVPLPGEIVRCGRLRRLLLTRNSITGPIPISMGANMRELEQLDLSSNQFNGSIPDDFGDLTSLQGTLNLAHNLLSGAIPPSLANLGTNVLLNLSYNSLSGAIPANAFFEGQGAAAYFGNPELCGFPSNAVCAPSPSPSPAGTPTPGDPNKKSLSKSAVVGIAVGAAVGGSLMASLFLYFCLRKLNCTGKNLVFQSPARSESGSGLRGCLCSWRDAGNGSVSSEDQEEGDLVHLDGALIFSLEELLRASAYVLGKSGVGIVYKAVLDDGTIVAVRRLGEGGEQRRKEFEAEVRTIAHVRHPHVVRLHSYYWTPDEKLLVYDFLPNGSLETALHGRTEASASKGPLTWEARMRIARGAAHGIAHIHECNPRKYVHGDIKPSNILLDAFLEARIADFGLQRLLILAGPEPPKEVESRKGDTGRASSVSPAPVLPSEFGRRSASPKAEMVAPFLQGVYQAPETAAAAGKKPNQKSDVYSFGVVLLELLTGRSPFAQLAAGELDLVSWMRLALQEKRPLSEIFDPYLVAAGNNDESKMIEALQVALACIAVSPESRPKMRHVADFFEQLQQASS